MTETPGIENLDTTRVGEILMRLPATAAMLRHASLQSTLGYVCEDPEPPEQEFVRDVLTMRVSEIVEKWYGGHDHATAIASALVASAIPRDGRPG